MRHNSGYRNPFWKRVRKEKLMKWPIEMDALWTMGFTWAATKSWSLVHSVGNEYFRVLRHFGPIHVLSTGSGISVGILLLAFAYLSFNAMILGCYFGKRFKENL